MDATGHNPRWPRRPTEWVQEVGGALGDVGTFLPLVTALTIVNGLDLGTTLIGTGLFNMAQGWMFQLPMPVQPMKAIAAIAIASDPPLSVTLIMSAGLCMSLAMAALSVTGAFKQLSSLLPRSLIRGVQLGLGLSMAIKGAALLWFLPPAATPDHSSSTPRPWLRPSPSEALLPPLLAASLILLLSGVASRTRAACGDTPSGLLLPSERGGAQEESNSRVRASCGQAGGLGAAGVVLLGEGREGEHQKGRCLGGGGRDRGDEETAGVEGEDHCADGARPLLGTRQLVLGAEESGMAGEAPSLKNGPPARMLLLSWLPPSILVVIAGLALGLISNPSVLLDLTLGPSLPRITPFSLDSLHQAAFSLALPQLALTVLNSVLAVCQLSLDLFPDRPPILPGPLSAWIALINGVGSVVGVMPVCTGAGGLAAQHRFGAHTGAAPIVLGALGAATGLLFGNSLLPLLRAFPSSFLGVLLLFSGLELSAAARDQTSKEDAFLCHVTALLTLSTKNPALGFLAGAVCSLLLYLHRLLVTHSHAAHSTPAPL